MVPPAFTLAQQTRDAEHPQGKWDVLAKCRLTTDSVADGESFHLTHQGREFIFRLYFVDAPEADASLSERAVDQASYFGVAAKDIPKGGRMAATFAQQKLAAREFTVVTRYQNALGRSARARFYSVVLVDGKNLAEELVANGWARIHGLKANWPDGERSATFINKRKNLELTAREKRLGIWNTNEFPRTSGAGLAAVPKENIVKGSGEMVDSGHGCLRPAVQAQVAIACRRTRHRLGRIPFQTGGPLAAMTRCQSLTGASGDGRNHQTGKNPPA